MKERHGTRQIAQWVAIVLLLALLAAMVAMEVTRSRNAPARERVKLLTYTRTDALSGYLFRNETALCTNNNGPVIYEAADGAQVAAGTVVARVFTDDTATDKRERAAALLSEIERCEAALAAPETPWPQDYFAAYGDLTRSLGTGSVRQGAALAAAVSETLTRRDAASETTAAALREQIAALRAEIDELTKYVDAPQAVPADENGRFYRATDGREALFGLSALEALTPETLSVLLNAPRENADTVGKLVTAGVWYLVAPVTADQAAAYTVGAPYRVLLTESAAAAELSLEKIVYAGDGASALLFLRGAEALGGIGAQRRLSFLVEKETVTGLRVPAAALVGDDTVFVEVDGVARARRVTPILFENGCLLAAPSDGEDALLEGERVLLGARRIYDGKDLNRYARS